MYKQLPWPLKVINPKCDNLLVRIHASAKCQGSIRQKVLRQRLLIPVRELKHTYTAPCSLVTKATWEEASPVREEEQGNLTGMTKTREARHSFRRVQVLQGTGREWNNMGAEQSQFRKSESRRMCKEAFWSRTKAWGMNKGRVGGRGESWLHPCMWSSNQSHLCA